MIRKQEQDRQANAYSNYTPKYQSCLVKQSMNCKQVFWIKSEIGRKKKKKITKPFVAAACSKQTASCGICIYIKKLNVLI